MGTAAATCADSRDRRCDAQSAAAHCPRRNAQASPLKQTCGRETPESCTTQMTAGATQITDGIRGPSRRSRSTYPLCARRSGAGGQCRNAVTASAIPITPTTTATAPSSVTLGTVIGRAVVMAPYGGKSRAKKLAMRAATWYRSSTVPSPPMTSATPPTNSSMLAKRCLDDTHARARRGRRSPTLHDA